MRSEAADGEAAQSEHSPDRGDDDAHDESVNEEGNDTDPEAGIARASYGVGSVSVGGLRCISGGGSGGCRSRRAGRGCAGSKRSPAAVAELGAGVILRAAFVAEHGCIHGGQYKSFGGRCKEANASFRSEGIPISSKALVQRHLLYHRAKVAFQFLLS